MNQNIVKRPDLEESEWWNRKKKCGSGRGLLSLYLPEATDKETEYLR